MNHPPAQQVSVAAGLGWSAYTYMYSLSRRLEQEQRERQQVLCPSCHLTEVFSYYPLSVLCCSNGGWPSQALGSVG